MADTRIDTSAFTATFVEPMECEIVSKLREGSEWVYEIKLDGYRAIAVRSGDKVSLFSRRRMSFNRQYPYIVEALSDLPSSLHTFDVRGEIRFHPQRFRTFHTDFRRSDVLNCGYCCWPAI
jgi:ATP-dependent DNA ligase